VKCARDKVPFVTPLRSHPSGTLDEGGTTVVHDRDRDRERQKTHESGPSFVDSDEQERFLWFEKSVVRILLDAAMTGGRLSVVENRTIRPYASPLHVHDVEDEAFIVLEGSIRAWVGDQRQDVSPGGVAFLPHGIPHAFRVTSLEAKFLVLGLPGGLEELYRGAGWDLRDPVPEGWVVSIPQLTSSEASRGNRVLGPPPNMDDP
jgi:mannose-6-phosphate isomerase-like protein (cupin superfamily)